MGPSGDRLFVVSVSAYARYGCCKWVRLLIYRVPPLSCSSVSHLIVVFPFLCGGVAFAEPHRETVFDTFGRFQGSALRLERCLH